MKTFLLALVLLVSFGVSAQINIQQINVKNAAMQMVYVGIENDFSIKIPSDVRLIKISSTVGEVKMTKDNTLKLMVKDINTAGVQFKYILGKNGVEQAEVTDPIVYKIKRVPDVFRLKVGTITQSGKIGLKEIKENMFIGLDDQILNIPLPLEKISLKVLHLPSNTTKQDPEELNITLNETNSTIALNQLLKKVKSGSKLFFEEIVVTLNDGTSRKIDPLSLLVE